MEKKKVQKKESKDDTRKKRNEREIKGTYKAKMKKREASQTTIKFFFFES